MIAALVGGRGEQIALHGAAAGEIGQGDADAGTDPHLQMVEEEGSSQAGGDAVRQPECQVAGVAAPQHHQELVTAETSHQIPLPQEPLQAAGDGHQQTIAHIVAVHVVDGLEVIQVDHAHGQESVPALRVVPEDALELALDAAPVPQPRERIGVRLAVQGPLLVQLTFVFAYAILAEAALSFLGIGVPPPAPSWGNIVAEGRDFAVEAWWIMLFPGLAISFAALGMNLLGDGLRDVLDPRLKVEG